MDLSAQVLVYWKVDKKYSIVNRSKIVDGNIRALHDKDLVGKETLLKWRSGIYTATIIKYGTSEYLEQQLEDLQNTAEGELPDLDENPPAENTKKRKTDKHDHGSQSVKKVACTKPTAKKTQVDKTKLQIMSVLDLAEPEDPGQIEFEANHRLEAELKTERELHKKFRDLYYNTKKSNDELKRQLTAQNEAYTIDIGGGVTVKTDVISTLKAISTTPNAFARNLFRQLFEECEVVGRSLMGKSCNANKGLPVQPSVDSNKRDAIINYSLAQFGIQQSNRGLYRLSLADVKRSLNALVQEMNRRTRAVETTLIEQNEGQDHDDN